MSAVTASDEHTASTRAKVIQPAWVRALHWTNAFAMVLMIMSGWQIYNASPLFDFRFSHSITLGGWLGGALLWHFAAMWLLMVNGLVYLVLGMLIDGISMIVLTMTIVLPMVQAAGIDLIWFGIFVVVLVEIAQDRKSVV